MFFILSKALLFLINPLVWMITLLSFGLFLKKEKWRKRSLQLCLVLLLFFSNSWISTLVLNAWETPPMLVADMEAPYDLAIVLSGYAKLGYDLPNEEQLFPFAGASNRLHHAVELYKLGKVKKILLSGGSGYVVNQEISESREVKRYLLRMGLPESDIIVEPASRNTHENALFTAELLKKINPQPKKILLITSAHHLPRARKCFTKVGLSVTPFAVDPTSNSTPFHLSHLVPHLSALNTWQSLFKEWIGCFVYWMKGWL